ncbi:MAG: ATP-dependent DNA helicase RecG [Defluviitaleaceae bacterium]|nr:ATP-dependent DNA helicase RecG [Defluviitaleaceae bacterium]
MNIKILKGIGPARTAALAQAGIYSVTDLLDYLPRDYDDRSEFRTVDSLMEDMVQTIRGYLHGLETVTKPRRGTKAMTLTKAKLKDATGMLEMVWFNQPYLDKYFKRGMEYVFTGAVKRAPNGVLQMTAPDYEVVAEINLGAGRIVPLYTPPKGFSQKTFRALVYQALARLDDGLCVEETLPDDLRVQYGLCTRVVAIRNIHFPESDEGFLQARRRLVFEELFLMQVALLTMKGRVRSSVGRRFVAVDMMPFFDRLPFAFTVAQARVLGDITGDMMGGYVLNRLVQGDVGSGKTAVAMAAAYIAIQNGTQAAIMAPTEVLAHQHYEGFSRVFAPLGIDTVLLTGALSVAERKLARTKMADGTAQMVIGTHALVQKSSRFHNLGLVITDEQHRFGVNQRFMLTERGTEETLPPHTLVMTATPIPRTLALILYGDLDISIIDELPPGRVPIKTYAVNSTYRERLHAFIRKETQSGRQAYVICPAINAREDDSQKTDLTKNELKNVTDFTQSLVHALPEIKIAHLHGRMKPDQKQQIMADFKANRIQILVSTTVIEVGVHVANAALMIIENAERFGLSQLHQLRGRVGRSTLQSYCILVSDAKAKQTRDRLQAMVETTDGFVLAERDLEQRGGGDFFGTRQHGLAAFKIANLYRDASILAEAQAAAREAIEAGTAGGELVVLEAAAGKYWGVL